MKHLARMLTAGLATTGMLVLTALLATPGHASDGSALGVDGGAVARSEGSVRQLTVGADLFIGDRVETDASGLVQIRFSDSTELVVGPNWWSVRARNWCSRTICCAPTGRPAISPSMR